MKKIALILFTALSFLLSCGESAEHKLLHEAHDIHMEAFKIKQAVEPQLEQLVQRSNSIQIQGRALTEEEIKFTESVNTLVQQLEFWKENHLEVPGFEHEEHDHSAHDHDHEHGSSFNLPASDMLLLQKEFRDSIVAIQQRVNSLLEQ